MNRFLCIADIAPGQLAVSLEERPEAWLLRQGGRASPLYPADGIDRGIDIPASCLVAFLAPRSSRTLIATLLYDCSGWAAEHIYVSHGLASVVLIAPDAEELAKVLEQAEAHILGYEVWPVHKGEVATANIEVRPPLADAAPWVDPVSDADLSYGMAAQVRQFNSNVAYLTSFAKAYFPELHELVVWLRESVHLHAENHRGVDAKTDLDAKDRQNLITWESLLLELNAILALFISQATSGAFPIHHQAYPVGEYSLLGIGGMVRSIWRVYSQLQRTFATFNHAGRIQERYRSIDPFNAYAASRRADYSVWKDNPAGIGSLTADAEPGRVHIPHFSSRWGFHESYYGMSLAWQCVHACATTEWSLLTITHEFLHSHVRDLLGAILDLDGDRNQLDRLVQKYNERNIGVNALESMQLALFEGLVGIKGAGRLASKVVRGPFSEQEFSEQAPVPDALTSDDLLALMSAHGGYVHELIVHVLDYLYIYNGEDQLYVYSIWSSWSRVPVVNSNIDHYVLRTLCAMTVTSDESEPEEVFEDVRLRLATALTKLRAEGGDRPTIDRALALLEDGDWKIRLGIHLAAARYVVNLVRHFLFDGSVQASIVADDSATPTGSPRYVVEIGAFRHDYIESPIGFILDRFSTYDGEGHPSVEYESLWQMLCLT